MMDIQEQRQGEVIVLGPVGRLDSLNCREFESHLLSALNDSGKVVVDCTALAYISSAGLRVLLVAAKQARATQSQLSLAALQDNPREVFDISGFSAIFSIHPTVEAAIASFG
ncbi:MAG TPA: STAS domain-containing protein [Candidatus Competibacteraceae bacterium]|nr:STAS domain-containing protein [Candidatus Competibacteraceae bacterium]